MAHYSGEGHKDQAGCALVEMKETVVDCCSPRVSFILQHRQQAAATTASHQLELTAMQTFLRQEIHRQNAHMDDMRSLCRLDMQVLVDDMKKVVLVMLFRVFIACMHDFC